jgi:DNA-binding NarL/FixJ family response regulator
MRAARVLIADGHEITRLGVKSTFRLYGTFEFCGDAADGHAGVEQA